MTETELLQHLLSERALRVKAVSAARHDDQPRQGRHPPRLTPGEQIEKRLRPDEEVKLPALAQRLQGVHGVRGAAAPQLQVGHLEARVLAHRPLRHLEAMRGRGQVGRRLVGRRRGRDEEDAVQREELGDLVGDEKMPEVNRVERPAEHADACGQRVTPGSARRRSRRTWWW
jgi:hypothetical protein